MNVISKLFRQSRHFKEICFYFLQPNIKPKGSSGVLLTVRSGGNLCVPQTLFEDEDVKMFIRLL